MLKYTHFGSPLSEREKMWPGEIKRVIGYMDICVECGSPYRRLSDGKPKTGICGRCWPASVEFSCKPSYGDDRASER